MERLERQDIFIFFGGHVSQKYILDYSYSIPIQQENVLNERIHICFLVTFLFLIKISNLMLREQQNNSPMAHKQNY